MKKMKILICQIIDFLSNDLIKVYGDTENVYIDNVADIEHINSMSLDWINPIKKDKQKMAEESKAKVILVDESVLYTSKMTNKILIVVKNPRMEISKIIEYFFVEKKTSFIHPSSIIDKNADIDNTAYIDAGCIIGNAKIGKNTVIRGNVTIYDNVIIGDNCLIQAGTVLGTDGLGCTRDNSGILVKFPHLGGIIIGNNVEIGANCQIAKGVLCDTIIKDGCKINGLCFIAHNCILEKNVWITGCSMLSGSTHVGENSTIYSRVVIREQCIIGKKCTIGMGSIVTKNIPDGETWYGCPAKKIEK